MQTFPQYTRFIHFIKTGELGLINHQMSKEKIKAMLGRPFNILDVYEGQSGKPEILTYQYKNLSIVFHNSKLVFLSIEFKSSLMGLPKELKIKWYEEVSQLTLKTFIEIIKTEKLSCERRYEPALVGDNVMLWLPKGRIEALFLPDTEFKLWKLTAASTSIGTGKWETTNCY